METNKFFAPIPASSVGLITNYRCTNRCGHCLYCSSPEVNENVDEDKLLRIVDEVGSKLPRCLLHIGGGETILYFDRLKRIISRIRKNDIVLEYAETNGVLLKNRTVDMLRELKSSGLRCMLLSISPFHNQFISVQEVERIYGAIVSVLGTGGIFPWHPGYFPFLRRVSYAEPISLEEYFSHFTSEEIGYQLTGIMYLHPGGRAAYLLAKHLPTYPQEKFFDHPCSVFLSSDVHAHIDYEGNYITGFCSGLRIGENTALNLKQLFGRGVEISRYPLLEKLTGGGIKELYRYALEKGYALDPSGYISACHLCIDIRVFLYFHDRQYVELYPSFLYEELGRMRDFSCCKG